MMSVNERRKSDDILKADQAVVDFIENWKLGFWANEPKEKPPIHDMRELLKPRERSNSSVR